jgi:hypothetical protein
LLQGKQNILDNGHFRPKHVVCFLRFKHVLNKVWGKDGKFGCVIYIHIPQDASIYDGS